MGNIVKLWMSKSSFTGGHSFWIGKPTLRPSTDFKDAYFRSNKSAERVTGDIYNLEKLFPNVVIKPLAGLAQVEIEEIVDGYIIRRVSNESE